MNFDCCDSIAKDDLNFAYECKLANPAPGLFCRSPGECKDSYTRGLNMIADLKRAETIDGEIKRNDDNDLAQGEILIIVIASIVTAALLICILLRSKCCTEHPFPALNDTPNPRDAENTKKVTQEEFV